MLPPTFLGSDQFPVGFNIDIRLRYAYMKLRPKNQNRQVETLTLSFPGFQGIRGRERRGLALGCWMLN